MPVLHDPELEHCKRSIDLLEYAKKTGYEVRPGDGGKAVTFLEHPNRDRIVVARSPNGPWIYASVNAYEPRTPGEPIEAASRRLREHIARTADKGTIVEFVQQRDWTTRLGEVSVEVVRERLRAYRESGLPLNFEGPLKEPNVARTIRSDVDRRVADERRVLEDVVRGVAAPSVDKTELNRRRYDWTPPPVAPPETEVEQRLRRWREAQGALNAPGRRPADVGGREPPPNPTVVAGRTVEVPASPGTTLPDRQRAHEKSELNRRRYDWTLAPEGIGAVPRGPRGRNPDRGR